MTLSNRRSLLKGAALLAGAGTVPALTKAAPGTDPKTPVAPAATDRVTAFTAKGIVETTSGKVRGYTRNGIHVFKGIPYAASTAGKNRFMPPVKLDPWAGVRSSMHFGSVCPNPPREGWKSDETSFMFEWDDGQPGEDCLRVNLWTPGIDNRKRPVMVWLHGGGFSAGSGQELKSYDGENLAHRGDVVVVSLNHRLNVFGHLDLSQFGGAQYASSGNVGMLDIEMALGWVRDNIASFGGDPAKVLIFGQSGGGGKVGTLMAMPSSRGLFHRAVIQSGSMLRVADPADTAKLAAAVLDELNISRSDIARLHDIPTDTLLNGALAAQRKAFPRPPGPPDFRHISRLLGWAPVVDGKVIPAQIFDPAAPAVSADVPLLVGTVLNEFVTGIGNPEAFDMTKEQLVERVKAVHGDKTAEIIDAFRTSYPNAKPFSLYSVIMTSSVRSSAVTQAARKAALGKAPAWLYWFTWQTPILDGRPMAFHCSELAFCFNNTDRCETMTGGGGRARALAARVSDAWINFARKGDPSHAGLPAWPPFDARKVPTMLFDDRCEMRNDPDGAPRRLMDSLA